MNKNLFASAVPKDVVRNKAGGLAYAMTDEAALAQYVMTGTFNQTFYASAAADATRVVGLAQAVDATFLAQLAVYGRQRGQMKDTPALLLAVLSVRDPVLFNRVFNRVVDNGRMLRNFVQAVRSGVAGRRSLGHAPKARVADWLNAAPVRTLLSASVGAEPSLADVIRLARPKAPDAERAALYGWLIGKPVDAATLPAVVRELVAFREAPERRPVPDVDFRLVDSFLVDRQWTEIARNAPWQMTRQNLNAFARHGVFESAGMVALVADRLRDADGIRRARVFPYQLLAAYTNLGNEVPAAIRDALHDAMEVAVANAPTIDGRVAVFVDVSGSMRSPVTGVRRGQASAASKVRCVDVAALVAAALLRSNRDAIVLPFDTAIVDRIRVEPRDSVMTNAQRLASVGGGGTACWIAMQHLLDQRLAADLLIYVSDNESWFGEGASARGAATAAVWTRYKARHPEAKLVCIDLTPNATVQVRTDADVLNIGGFSDAVFDVLASFARGESRGTALVDAIRALPLD